MLQVRCVEVGEGWYKAIIYSTMFDGRQGFLLESQKIRFQQFGVL